MLGCGRGVGSAMAACLAALCGAPAAAQGLAEPPYSIKPSEVEIPEGKEMGQYQRVIRPFGNWTLICDEDLTAHERICNVTQTIEDRNGTMAFSWSLAATETGDPYMILRAAPDAAREGVISLEFDSRDEPVDVHIDGCNRRVCIGMVPVGPILRGQIAEETSPLVSYQTADGDAVEIETTLEGLSRAFEAIE